MGMYVRLFFSMSNWDSGSEEEVELKNGSVRCADLCSIRSFVGEGSIVIS